MKTTFNEGTVFKDVVNNKKSIKIGKNGELKITVPKQSIMVFVE